MNLQELQDSLKEAMTQKVKFVLLDKRAVVPTKATDGSACFDLVAVDSAIIAPNSAAVIGTGISIALPINTVLSIYSRSGHGFKNNVRLSNCVGKIDSDYRGEIKVSLFNDSDTEFEVKKGARIAQCAVDHVIPVNWIQVDSLNETERGDGGFGSTGTN